MKMKQGAGFANAYNIQSVTENGVILSNSVFTASPDVGALIPTLQHFQGTHGHLPERLLADKGFSSENNYAFCEDAGIDAYIPPHQEATDLSGFRYDRRRDAYMDERGRVYVFKQHADLNLNPCYRCERTTTISKSNDLQEAGGHLSPLLVGTGWKIYVPQSVPQKRALSCSRNAGH